MSKRERDLAGYLLPEVIDPETCVCVCVPIPNDPGHIRAFLGQLDYLGYWWTWERDDDHKGTQAAQVWRGVAECVRSRLDNDCGCGGSSQPQTPMRERWVDGDTLEVSFDGGETWQDGSNWDARNTVTTFPPRSDSGDTSRCSSSEGIRHAVESAVETIITTIDSGGTVASAAAALIPILISLGFAAALGALLAILYGLIGVVSSLVSAGLSGSFDTTFWDTFQCWVYCLVDDDGTITDADIEELKTKAADYFGAGNPLAIKTLQDTIGLMGAIALSNAAKASASGGDSCGGCDDCGCDCPDDETTEIVYGADVMTYDPLPDETGFDAGTYYATWNTPPVAVEVTIPAEHCFKRMRFSGYLSLTIENPTRLRVVVDGEEQIVDMPEVGAGLFYEVFVDFSDYHMSDKFTWEMLFDGGVGDGKAQIRQASVFACLI